MQTGGRALLPSHLPFINVLICQLTQIAGGTSLQMLLLFLCTQYGTNIRLKETELSYRTYE